MMRKKSTKIKRFYVYKITNTINNKLYYGKSHTNKNRWRDHLGTARRKDKNRTEYVHYCINKYGANNFIYEIIEYFDFELDAYDAEQKYIAMYNTTDKRFGMNIMSGGKGGSMHSPESIEKIRQKRIGFKFSGEAKNLMSKSHLGQRPVSALFSNEEIKNIKFLYHCLKLFKFKNIIKLLTNYFSVSKHTILSIVGNHNYGNIIAEYLPSLPPNIKICPMCQKPKI